jgi:hypothetical protein
MVARRTSIARYTQNACLVNQSTTYSITCLVICQVTFFWSRNQENHNTTLNALSHRLCSSPYISQQRAVKVTDVHLLYYSRLSDARYTHCSNYDVVNTAITKGPINPEKLNWCHSMKFKSIKSISEYSAKKQSPPTMSLSEDLLWRHWSVSSRTPPELGVGW